MLNRTSDSCYANACVRTMTCGIPNCWFRGGSPPWLLVGVLVVLLGAGGCSRSAGQPTSDPPLLVFAAASLRDVMTEVGEAHFAGGGSRVEFSFASSNSLALQLEAAPRADVFLSASEAWMDRVEAAGRLVPGTRRPLLGNALVCVVNRESRLQARDACALRHQSFEHLVLGDPAAVPAGIYARQYLSDVRCEDGAAPWVAMAERVLPLPDVRAALAQVEALRDAVGFVYRTDAATSSRVRVLFEVTGDSAPRITYPAAVVAGAAHEPEARGLIRYIRGAEATAIFTRHGFAMLALGDT